MLGSRQLRLRRTQFKIGLPVDRAHRTGKFIERRSVDELHRKRQRHAEHDGQRGGRVAPWVVSQFLPGEGSEQGAHGLLCRPDQQRVGVKLCQKLDRLGNALGQTSPASRRARVTICSIFFCRSR